MRIQSLILVALSILTSPSRRERDWVLGEFKAGRSPILIATDVASRGLGMFSFLKWQALRLDVEKPTRRERNYFPFLVNGKPAGAGMMDRIECSVLRMCERLVFSLHTRFLSSARS